VLPEYKNKMPWWVEDKHTKYDLCLTDDIDSLLSCIYLNQIKGYDINYFYSFNKIYKTDQANPRDVIAVDADFTKNKIKCWGNHVTMINPHDIYNSNCANLNVIDKINRQNYFNKYCGSTVLQIMSYYDISLPDSELAKMILLAIDSTFAGYYSRYENDNIANKYYLVEVLQFPELFDLLTKHTRADFIRLIEDYSLNQKIMATNGSLTTSIDLKGLEDVFLMPIRLPEQEFHLAKSYKTMTHSLSWGNTHTTKNHLHDNIISLAVTNRNFINYTIG
jgi:hypothetical protein